MPSLESLQAVEAAAALEMPSTFVEDMNIHTDAGGDGVLALSIEACCCEGRT